MAVAADWTAAAAYMTGQVRSPSPDWPCIGGCGVHVLTTLASWTPDAAAAASTVSALLDAVGAWVNSDSDAVHVGVTLVVATAALCRLPHAAAAAGVACSRIAAVECTRLPPQPRATLLGACCHAVRGMLETHAGIATASSDAAWQLVARTLQAAADSGEHPDDPAATVVDAAAAAVSVVPLLSQRPSATAAQIAVACAIIRASCTFASAASGAAESLPAVATPLLPPGVAVGMVDALLSCDHTAADASLAAALLSSTCADGDTGCRTAASRLLSAGGAHLVRWCTVPAADGRLTLWERARLLALLAAACGAPGILGGGGGSDHAAPLDTVLAVVAALVDPPPLVSPLRRRATATAQAASATPVRTLGRVTIGMFVLQAAAPVAAGAFAFRLAAAPPAGSPDVPLCAVALLDAMWAPAGSLLLHARRRGTSGTEGATLTPAAVSACLRVVAAAAGVGAAAGAVHAAVSRWVSERIADTIVALVGSCHCDGGCTRASASALPQGGDLAAWLARDTSATFPLSTGSALAPSALEDDFCSACVPPLSATGPERTALVAALDWAVVERGVRTAVLAAGSDGDRAAGPCVHMEAALAEVRAALSAQAH
jgi:hypothetical protein